jgi:hypothetical protein
VFSVEHYYSKVKQQNKRERAKKNPNNAKQTAKRGTNKRNRRRE